MNLTTEQYRLLDTYYKGFVRSGSLLNEEQKERLRELNKELSALTLQFGNNLLDETNDFKLVIDNEEDLAGLPEGVIAAAAETAQSQGEEGKWVFGLQKPSWLPFLQYSEKRELREKLYKAMYNRGDNDNEKDNKQIINSIVNLRVEKAQLLGYDSHAHFILEENMAKTPENVYQLLNEVWDYALPQAKKEATECHLRCRGATFAGLMGLVVDTEKLRQQKYALNEEEVKPYFKMENARRGL